MGSVIPVKATFATAHGDTIVSSGVSLQKTPCASSKYPVDLVHLSRQTLGDRSLEVEILRLFKSQSTLYIERLANASTADERNMAAHTVIGFRKGAGSLASGK